MKTLVLMLTVAVLTLPALAGEHPMATESGWFDLQNCEFCKNLTTDPGLLQHMTWETHKIENGMMYITTIDPHYRESYNKANQAMETLGTDMMSGKVNPMQVKMCGSCADFGMLMMAGAKMEMIQGEAADISLITSTNPDVVAKLHAHADRDNEEMAAMMAAGHDHGDHEHHVH
jgi:hypothetical protein